MCRVLVVVLVEWRLEGKVGVGTGISSGSLGGVAAGELMQKSGSSCPWRVESRVCCCGGGVNHCRSGVKCVLLAVSACLSGLHIESGATRVWWVGCR